MTEALILQHGELGPPGLLGRWAEARGIPFTVRRVDLGDPLPQPDGQPFIASLGSRHSPNDVDVAHVAAELEFVARAVQRGIPILGLCFGGQLLSRLLGGTVTRAREPELGWHVVTPSSDELVAPGPWLQWHYETFTLPPGAEPRATSAVGLQAFTCGPHLGVQFHPESTVEIVKRWAARDRERLAGDGIDGEELVERGRVHAEAAANSAFRLFDAFWSRAWV